MWNNKHNLVSSHPACFYFFMYLLTFVVSYFLNTEIYHPYVYIICSLIVSGLGMICCLIHKSHTDIGKYAYMLTSMPVITSFLTMISYWIHQILKYVFNKTKVKSLNIDIWTIVQIFRSLNNITPLVVLFIFEYLLCFNYLHSRKLCKYIGIVILTFAIYVPSIVAMHPDSLNLLCNKIQSLY